MRQQLKLTLGLLLISAMALTSGCNGDDTDNPIAKVTLPSAASFGSSSLVVSEDGEAQTIALSLDIEAVDGISIMISFASDNATYGEDFTTTPAASSESITLEIPAGSSEGSITFQPVDNDMIDGDKKIDFTIVSVGEVALTAVPPIAVFIEDNEVSTLLLSEDFASYDFTTNDLNNAFITDSWIQVNGNGQVFSQGADMTLSGFAGNGVGGSLEFDNTGDSPTGTTFLNAGRRIVPSTAAALSEETFSAGTYYAAFNFTLKELDAATGVRRYVAFGKIRDNGTDEEPATSLAATWGAKMGIKGVVEDGVQKYYFGLHKRLGVSGIFADMVVPEGAVARDLGTTYLVVLKVVQIDAIESGEGEELTTEEANSEAYLYVFAEGDDYSVEPATPYATDLVGGDVNINAFILLGDQNNHAAAYDGIRVAEDWMSLFQ